MKSHTTERFRKAFSELPHAIQEQAGEVYELFKKDPFHPGLNFKRVHSREPIYSVRIGLHYRAVGVQAGNAMIWFWIGSHSEYDRLLKRL